MAAPSIARRAMIVSLIVACAFFMEQLDATIIVTALPKMAGTFGVLPTRMSVAVTSYILALAACIPASGWLAVRIGPRNLFCIAIGLFAVASILCGLAPNFPAFIAARVLQGAAGAMMSPVGRMVVLRTTEKQHLMRALSTLVWPALIAPVIGPPLGGFITSVASWRWIFYVNLPVAAVGIALALAFVPAALGGDRKPFDLGGFILIALGLALLTYGLDLLGRPGAGWRLGAALLAAAVAIGFAAVRHAERAAHPLLSLHALRVKSFFISGISGGLVSRAAISATPFLLPLMFQLGFGLSPVASGSLLLFYMAANLLMKTVTNPIMRRFGLKRVLAVNGTIAALAIACCAVVSPADHLLVSGLLLAIAGASRSMQFTALTMVTFADVPAAELPSATVFSALTQQTGMGMGVAVGALMLNVSQAVRHSAVLSLFDFRIALALTGLFGLTAVLSYAGLAPDVGDEISKHKRA